MGPRTPVEERCQLLERAAAILDRRRFELSALEVFEVGKALGGSRRRHPRGDGFLPFLRAANAPHLADPRLTQHVPGEKSYQHYWPRGVASGRRALNFPVAILAGMVTAALVTGNAVIMKTGRAVGRSRRDLDGSFRRSRRVHRAF